LAKAVQRPGTASKPGAKETTPVKPQSDRDKLIATVAMFVLI